MTGLEELDRIDFGHAAMMPDPLSDAYRARHPEDPWLARRTLAWGGSEVSPLLFAYGLAPLGVALPGWVIEQGEHYARLGVPKIIAWKANLRARPKGDTKTKDRGKDRERELLARWRSGTARHRVDPKTIRHADTVPQEWFPLVDRRGVPLAVTPDAWARAASDRSLVAIEIKCTFKPLTEIAAPWHYRMQLQAEMAVMNAAGGILVVGERWVDHRDSESEPDGPIRAFAVAPDPATVALIRTVATEAWALVEELQTVKDPKHCRELWDKSARRMAEYRDAASARLEDALNEVDGLDDLTNFAA